MYIHRFETIARTEDGRKNVTMHLLENVDPRHEYVIARLRMEMDGEVYTLWVHPGHRRQGHATDLWNIAAETTGTLPKHSAWRTDDGDAFARSIGGHLPERKVA